MDLISTMTDVHGPRLTGSPQIRSASEWAKQKLSDMGLADAHLEPWGPFGRGWSLEGFKPDHAKFAGYFNLDNGTGKIRGIHLQGNEACRPIFRAWLAPFRDMGASTVTVTNTGGTDHLSFDGVGLPGFQFIQDPIEYETRTHHSSMDVYERIQEDDMKQASVIMASVKAVP